MWHKDRNLTQISVKKDKINLKKLKKNVPWHLLTHITLDRLTWMIIRIIISLFTHYKMIYSTLLMVKKLKVIKIPIDF